MDTSKIGGWFSRQTTDSGAPWSDRVTAADEAAHRVRHADGHRAQGELAQARGQQRAAGEPADHHAAGQQRHRLRRDGASFRIVQKRVDLINCDSAFEAMAVPI